MSDYIDRQAALASIKALFPDMPKIDFMDNRSRWREVYSQYLNAEEAIRQVPSADVEPVRHAKRTVACHEENSYSYVCEACGIPVDICDIFCRGFGFCRGCGERVDGERDDGKGND